jgi:hypothetical protein
MGKPPAFFKGVFKFFRGLRHGRKFFWKFKIVIRTTRATGAKNLSERLAERQNGTKKICDAHPSRRPLALTLKSFRVSKGAGQRAHQDEDIRGS